MCEHINKTKTSIKKRYIDNVEIIIQMYFCDDCLEDVRELISRKSFTKYCGYAMSNPECEIVHSNPDKDICPNCELNLKITSDNNDNETITLKEV